MYLRQILLIMFALFCFAVTGLSQSSDKSIDRLKAEHNKLKAIADDQNILAEIRGQKFRVCTWFRSIRKGTKSRACT